MSGPYRFTHESAKSPLDRTQGPFSADQPVSYKTNVNRAKTKKWVTAKKNAYDGDDWGEYDEYDEYGVDQEPPSPEPASSRYYAQPQRTYTDRSFTEPQGPPGKARRNSFETGEEHRAFSASIPQTLYGQQQYEAPPQPDPHSPRDFSPSAMPPPLQTRVSPMPSGVVPPSGGAFPPRKSSIGQLDAPLATSPRSDAGPSAEKSLPFIRPADIYRRVEEERERERASTESSRPSLDSLTSRPKEDLQSPTIEAGKSLKPLETVAERKSEYLPDFNVAASSPSSQQIAPANNVSAASPSKDEGFYSFVDQAFARTDDQRSVPPTPISKALGTDISRSNTDSTSGISPIMSRVPSSATSALKRSQAAGEGSTPVIAEETHEPATTFSGPTPVSAHGATPKAVTKSSADHTRDLSSSSLPRSSLATPTCGDSPARAPIIAPQKSLPDPEAAHLFTESTERSDLMQGGLNGPSSAYARREADIASAVKAAPGSAAPGLCAAEKDSQNAFLESHHAQDTIDDAVARSRSESPSKGRVQALASTFGAVSSSRRGSAQSNGSRHSIQSWEKSHDNSRAPSPTKGPTKPRSPVKEFRPHLPGQWESFATTTTAVTPSDQGDLEPAFCIGIKKESSQDEVELTPTTTKFPVKEVKMDDGVDPLTALRSAGAAMVASLGATVGLDQSSHAKGQSEEQARGRPHGNLYMPRPLQLDRTASSISSLPPTPPAKDTPVNEQPPPPPLKEKGSQPVQSSSLAQQQQRPAFLPQLSTAPSAEDEESDRLRKEIVASLSPVRSLEPAPRGQDRLSIQSDGSEAHRISSVLPAEYDSYWADGGRKPSQDTEREIHPTERSITPPSTQPPQLGLLNRFSWEANSSKLMTPDSANKGVPVPEPVKQPTEDKDLPPVLAPAAEVEPLKTSARTSSSHFGPEHNITINEPVPTTDSAPFPQSTKSPVDLASLSSPIREQTRSPGLHVVNSADNPEAVDLPPRLSADLKSPVQPGEDHREPQIEQAKDLPNPAVSTTAYPTDLPTIRPIDQSTDAPVQPVSAASPTSPTGDKAAKPRDGREIATINSASERISSYNQSRDQWATHDHGLEGWLSSALEATPELLTQSQPIMSPTSGTVRHKHTASLSMLGKFGGSSTNQALNTEAFSAGTPQTTVGGSPTAAPYSGNGFDRRVASAQMQMKGKDLLHSAEKLSGKGLTSAKGLFAKGKSRFGREKVEK